MMQRLVEREKKKLGNVVEIFLNFCAENGCLFAVPGSHLKDPSAFFRRKPSGVAEWDKNYDPNEFVSLKGEH